jgi:teichuronic acid biosynthesis glycosyltransferase TuaC
VIGRKDAAGVVSSSDAEPRPLRILNLARSYPNNVFPGLGLWTERPTRRIAKTCDVRVISPVPYFPPLPHIGRFRQYTRFREVERFGVLHGVQVERPRFVVGFGSSLYRLEARAYEFGIRHAAERLHREAPFDLVHAHFIYPDGVAGGELARRWDVPLVVTEHAPWTGWLERPGVRGPALSTARRASRLIAVSSAVRDSIVAYTADPSKVVVVPNGVDPTMYELGRLDKRDPDQILFVGLINRNKGIDVLLEAMRKVVRERPAARLLLAGGSFYRNTRLQGEALEKSAADLISTGRVTFLGHRSPDEVADLMARSATVVLPSRAESFGSVLIEALACGTPVVATRCGGPEDIVEDTVGRLVPTEDPDALAYALLDVLGRRDAFDPDALRAYAISRFSWDSVVARTLQVYLEVTASWGSQRAASQTCGAP